MCGINGFTFSDKNLIQKMKLFTKRRGPDADGIFISDEITISHDRLSIIDLSNHANQPMERENLVLSFNGEIYNYKELKKELENDGFQFKTNSDSEVILLLFLKYNIESFKKLKGIFAISIWDKNLKKLYLIRDIVGVKPLYYFRDKNNLFFSSSIRSILISQKNKRMNFNAFMNYANFGRNDLKETIFKDIFKLRPGELIIKSKNNFSSQNFLNFKFSQKKYNNEEIKYDIKKQINNQLVSDVPLGLSLSGGVDSNVIYSVMREKFDKKFNIYSFYFDDYEKFNEDFNVAKANSNYFGNNFIPINIGYKDFIENSEKVAEILEEPSGNQCSILNYTMSKNINEKILITGDGGDETFTGYDRYRSMYIIQQIQKFNFLKELRPKFKNKNLNRLFMTNPKDLFLSFSEQNLYKNSHLYYKNFNYIQKDQLSLNHTKNFSLENRLNSISFLDLDTVVPNEYLLRNDKIFANEGIEVRVPLLDENIINNHLNISEHKKFGYKIESKSLLRTLFKKEIFSLTKQKWGMQSPYGKWMKNILQKFIKEILCEEYYDNSKIYFNFTEIKKLIKMHENHYQNPDIIWSLIMMQIFLRKFKL